MADAEGVRAESSVAAMKASFLARPSATQGNRRRFSNSRLLALAALLAQFQLLWLAGFHYHPEITGAGQSRPAVAADRGQQGAPADGSSSCAFCQIIRHSTSGPPAVVAFSFHISSTIGLTLIAAARPLARPQVRLAGRDPPYSFLASC
jgi:hypothetical protein